MLGADVADYSLDDPVLLDQLSALRRILGVSGGPAAKKARKRERLPAVDEVDEESDQQQAAPSEANEDNIYDSDASSLDQPDEGSDEDVLYDEEQLLAGRDDDADDADVVADDREVSCGFQAAQEHGMMQFHRAVCTLAPHALPGEGSPGERAAACGACRMRMMTRLCGKPSVRTPRAWRWTWQMAWRRRRLVSMMMEGSST